MTNRLENDLTRGSVWKMLLYFMIPIFLANMLQTLYTMVDTVVVGRYIGSVGISAVTVGSQVANIFACVGMGFANGGQVVVSQLMGTHDRDGLRRAIGTLFSLSVLVGVIVGVLGYVFAGPLLGVMNTPEEAWKQAGEYMRISCFGFVFIFIYNAISCVMRGLGDSTRPLIFVGIASVLNIVLDIAFVSPRGLNMGAGGAALATIIAQGLSAAFGIVYLFRRREHFAFDFKKESFRIEARWAKELARMGIPQIFQMAAITVSMLYVLAMINNYGVLASATIGIGNRVNNLYTMPFHAMNTASCSMAGQNAGANRYDRVNQIAWLACAFNFFFFLVTTAVSFLWGSGLVGIFDSDPQVQAWGHEYLKILSVSMFGHVFFCSFNATSLGIGNALLSTVASVMDGVVVRLALCILSVYVFHWGLMGIFWANSIPAAVNGAIQFGYYLSGKWRTYRKGVLKENAV